MQNERDSVPDPEVILGDLGCRQRMWPGYDPRFWQLQPSGRYLRLEDLPSAPVPDELSDDFECSDSSGSVCGGHLWREEPSGGHTMLSGLHRARAFLELQADGLFCEGGVGPDEGDDEPEPTPPCELARLLSGGWRFTGGSE